MSLERKILMLILKTQIHILDWMWVKHSASSFNCRQDQETWKMRNIIRDLEKAIEELKS